MVLVKNYILMIMNYCNLYLHSHLTLNLINFLIVFYLDVHSYYCLKLPLQNQNEIYLIICLN